MKSLNVNFKKYREEKLSPRNTMRSPDNLTLYVVITALIIFSSCKFEWKDREEISQNNSNNSSVEQPLDSASLIIKDSLDHIRDQIALGQSLFESKCVSCHSIYDKVVGPPLRNSTENHSMKWLIAWSKNNRELRNSGDKDAIKIFQEYAPAKEPSFSGALSDEEIVLIYRYIDSRPRTQEEDRKVMPASK